MTEKRDVVSSSNQPLKLKLHQPILRDLRSTNVRVPRRETLGFPRQPCEPASRGLSYIFIQHIRPLYEGPNGRIRHLGAVRRVCAGWNIRACGPKIGERGSTLFGSRLPAVSTFCKYPSAGKMEMVSRSLEGGGGQMKQGLFGRLGDGVAVSRNEGSAPCYRLWEKSSSRSRGFILHIYSCVGYCQVCSFGLVHVPHPDRFQLCYRPIYLNRILNCSRGRGCQARREGCLGIQHFVLLRIGISK